MNKISVAGIIIAVVFLLHATCSVVSSTESNGAILHVGGTEKPNYNTIQDAINASSNGDVVLIHDGIYYESILISHSIKIIGEHKENVVLDGSERGSVITVNADDVVISNLLVRNGTRDLDNSSDVYAGVYVENMSSLSISNCTVKDCYIGVLCINVSDVRLSSLFLFSNRGGLNLYNVSTGSVNYCVINQNSDLYGAALQKANNLTVSNNNFSVNHPFGLVLSESSNNIFYKNVFLKNTNGVYVFRTMINPCHDNLFYHNNFIENPTSASDSCEDEHWDNGAVGNYWSNYDSTEEGAFDNNSDGFIDRPLKVPPFSVNNSDRFPLGEPVNIVFTEAVNQSRKDVNVTILSPMAGETLSGNISIQGTALCTNATLDRIKVKFDVDSQWYNAIGTSDWNITINTERYANGNHTLMVYAEALDGTYDLETVSVSILNGASTPTRQQPDFTLFTMMISISLVVFIWLKKRMVK